MKPKRILFLAILSGLITTLIFYMLMDQESPNAVEEEVTLVKVVAATQDIQENEKITEESVSVRELPEDQVHSQAVREPKMAVGKFATAEIKTGEQIMIHRIEQPGEENGMVSKKVTEGHRAVSISVDYVKSVSNLIEPEDHVDVVLSEQVDDSPHTEMILENVRVLSVGKRMVEKKPDETEEEYHAVTLELTQTDAIELINASERGNLQLVLLSKRLTEEDHEKVAGEEEVEGEATLEASDSNLIPLPERSLIRESPSLQAPLVTVVDEGTQLRYLNEQQMDQDERLWLYVEVPDQDIRGWISSRIIKGERE